MPKPDPRRDDTAYLEELLDRTRRVEALEAQVQALTSRALPADWYHTKVGIWRPYESTGRAQLIARRLPSGLVMSRHTDFWAGLVIATPSTPPDLLVPTGEDNPAR